MDAAQILDALPADLAWAVFFRLAPVRALAPDARVRQMFFLSDDEDLDGVSHVVLTARGRALAPTTGSTLRAVGVPALLARAPGERSLRDAHAGALARLRLDRADCVGLGSVGDRPPACLHVEIVDGVGQATAIFSDRPSGRHYDLLPAVGVEFRGGVQDGDRFVASFQNRLRIHLHAGALAGFSRTGNCNAFFLLHGAVDDEIRDGLVLAARDRVGAARRAVVARLVAAADEATRRPMPMTCVPPDAAAPFAYGDLVPLGFLARGLRSSPEPEAVAAAERVVAVLEAARDAGGLWAFHRGRLPTATDSALVMLGFDDPRALAALEAFSDGQGGYLPQRADPVGGAGRMVAAPCNRHWRQQDLGTTCLVRALRARAGLPTTTPTEVLRRAFPGRSALFFANAWLVDWLFALAIADDPDAADLRDALRGEILASRSDDGSFGRYDRALSTALAILALAALGERGRVVRMAQVRLADAWADEGSRAPATPFFSTHLDDADGATADPARSRIESGGGIHELSRYVDVEGTIRDALAAEALAVDADASQDAAPRVAAATPRYRCDDVAAYVAQHALPPYLLEPA